MLYIVCPMNHTTKFDHDYHQHYDLKYNYVLSKKYYVYRNHLIQTYASDNTTSAAINLPI
jgi:hypothetical protein